MASGPEEDAKAAARPLEALPDGNTRRRKLGASWDRRADRDRFIPSRGVSGGTTACFVTLCGLLS